ncbi:polyhydroxyalkanoate synthesis regulator DNA-binding domain-containing protein [Candidatus Chloroploca asiatica]|uniref:Pesticidal protein Cry15Aa n=1 Tax=Candidatus Chloroploca asiatica TaxID=1506545 RepID=A0A2H3KMX2_9CHLR|nr:polyhydroxyalkanoate synthesis regulator DNA-binding domain-containing protein [Candidatus Chloroploca asiatica]PDV99513.1 pesticidal protein Cry15Aa [Candidatus Chloroploca asiatica]
MNVIKKYANRKLYHTNRKQYITLDGIAKLVQEGEPVRVLDNETGEDITSVILAQVVLQSRGRNGTQLPTQLLTGLIQVGGDTISSLRRSLATSLGGAEVLDGEIERRIDYLVVTGALTAEESQRWRHLLTGNHFNQPAENSIDAMPSRNDVARLHEQVDALSLIIEQLANQREHEV